MEPGQKVAASAQATPAAAGLRLLSDPNTYLQDDDCAQQPTAMSPAAVSRVGRVGSSLIMAAQLPSSGVQFKAGEAASRRL